MKKFPVGRIVGVLKQAELGVPVAELILGADRNEVSSTSLGQASQLIMRPSNRSTGPSVMNV